MAPVDIQAEPVFTKAVVLNRVVEAVIVKGHSIEIVIVAGVVINPVVGGSGFYDGSEIVIVDHISRYDREKSIFHVYARLAVVLAFVVRNNPPVIEDGYSVPGIVDALVFNNVGV